MDIDDRIKEVEELINDVCTLEAVADEMQDKEAAKELRRASRDAFIILVHYREILKKEKQNVA